MRDLPDSVSVLICTRNRGSRVVPAVQSVLDSCIIGCELLVVDQSEDEQTRDALAPFFGSSQFKYLKVASKGKGRALNRGIEGCLSSLILITDDDCEVPADWVEEMCRAVEVLGNVGAMFCRVAPGPCEPSKGHIPFFEPSGEVAYSMQHRLHSVQIGIGAGMAISRAAFNDVGGFDDQLGPGSTFPSADESDFAYRVLLKGYLLGITNRTTVIHHGFRTWAQLTTHTKRDVMASGAMLAKLTRYGHTNFAQILAALTAKWFKESMRNLLHLKRLQGVRRTAWLYDGFWSGWQAPVNRRTLRFELTKEQAEHFGKRFVKRDV